MIAGSLVFILFSFQQFCVQSLESVLVCVFVNLMYRLVYKRMEDIEEALPCEGPDLECEGPDLEELPDCYALPDHQKTARIQDLEREVEVLNRQLVETRNHLNTLITEIDKYKRVHGQVSWLLEQFRHTLTGVYDKPKLEAILPPPPPPPPLPLHLPVVLELPPPPSSYTNSTDDVFKEVSTIDLTISDTSQVLSVSGGSEASDYSDDWETTEEVTASDSTTSVGNETCSACDSPPLPDLATLLANVDTKTHISEIFRRLTSS